MNYTLFKKINYEQETVEKKNLIKSLIATIHSQMSELGHVYINHSENINSEKIDLVFSVGGDGSMMHSINSFIEHDPIYIGINAGNLGFLTAYDPNDVFNGKVFQDLEKNKRIELRSLIECHFNDTIKTAANELAIYPKEINQIIDFSMEIENNNSNIFRRAGTYLANALLLSTPIGSTAYTKNVGGAIVDPNSYTIQFALVASMNSGTHPILFNEGTKIKIIANRPLDVFVDGIKSFELLKGDFFYANVFDQKAQFLLPPDWNYFNILSKKLLWNNGKEI